MTRRSRSSLPRFDADERQARRRVPRGAGAPRRRPDRHDRARPDARPVRRGARGAAGRLADRLRRPVSARHAGVAGGVTVASPPRRSPVARECAQNAIDTNGRVMILLGAGINHWFHSDQIYRAMLVLTTITGCQGRQRRRLGALRGPGEGPADHGLPAHGLRAWTGCRPPRHMIQTAYWYVHTDQFRYDTFTRRHAVGYRLAQARFAGRASRTCSRSRPGWAGRRATPPSTAAPSTSPTTQRPPAGRSADYVVEQLKAGDLHFAVRGPRRAGELSAHPLHVAGQPPRQLGQGQRVLPASTCSAPTALPRPTRRPRTSDRVDSLARRGARGQARPAAARSTSG